MKNIFSVMLVVAFNCTAFSQQKEILTIPAPPHKSAESLKPNLITLEDETQVEENWHLKRPAIDATQWSFTENEAGTLSYYFTDPATANMQLNGRMSTLHADPDSFKKYSHDGAVYGKHDVYEHITFDDPMIIQGENFMMDHRMLNNNSVDLNTRTLFKIRD